MNNRIQKSTWGYSLLLLMLAGSSLNAQSQTPSVQQQVKNSFNQAKHRVASLFGRQASQSQSNQRAQPPANQRAQPPHLQPARNQHYQPAPQHFRQRPPANQSVPMRHQPMVINHEQHQRMQQGIYQQPQQNMMRQAAFQQPPSPDPNTQYADPNFDPTPRDPAMYQEAGLPQRPTVDPRQMPQNNAQQPNQIVAEPWGSHSESNYHNYLRSSAAVAPKPQAMDHYNQHQYQHFSNRISATERAIILEDELAKIREEKKTLESKIRSLESKLKQRDYEITQLQNAVNDSIQQLSQASDKHSQLQKQLETLTALRNQERADSNILLDELRRQLNDLLASELVGAG